MHRAILIASTLLLKPVRPAAAYRAAVPFQDHYRRSNSIGGSSSNKQWRSIVVVAALAVGIAPVPRMRAGQLWLATRFRDGGALGIVAPHVAVSQFHRVSLWG